MYKIYKVYATVRIVVSAMINIWLIVATLLVLDIISKSIGYDFVKEKRRIKCINWTFAATYSMWMIAEIIFASTGLPN